jgi:hypothetical protein
LKKRNSYLSCLILQGSFNIVKGEMGEGAYMDSRHAGGVVCLK